MMNIAEMPTSHHMLLWIRTISWYKLLMYKL